MRRTVSRCAALFLTAVLLTACGGKQSPSRPSGEPSVPAVAAPDFRDELRVAENQFPTSLDGDLGFAGYSLMSYGIAETLMKVTPQMKVEPWIAERIEQTDPLTWRITIRGDVTFWDGARVDAAAVKASLERSIEKQKGAVASLLPPGTQFIADGQVLTLKTPEPVGPLPTHLAAHNLTIKKVGPSGELIYTGPYRYENYVERTSLTLTAYEAYRGGKARTRMIRIRYIPDVNTRVLALQSGDVDIAHAILPSQVNQLQTAGFQVTALPFGRQNDMILNVRRPPLDDVKVRQAISHAIDRQTLLTGVMKDAGTVALGLAPENIGLNGVVRSQKFDQAEASRLLDEAGWTRGADGIRVKDGRRLGFTLGFYASRAELEPLATVIRDQLKAVGMEIKLENYPDINTTVANSAFDATMYSYGVAPYGDVGRAIATLYTPSGTNKDRYSNSEVNNWYKQYTAAADAGKRQELFRQMQELVGRDVPVVYVVNPYQIVAAAKGVVFTPHPLENYKIDTLIGITK